MCAGFLQQYDTGGPRADDAVADAPLELLCHGVECAGELPMCLSLLRFDSRTVSYR